MINFYIATGATDATESSEPRREAVRETNTGGRRITTLQLIEEDLGAQVRARRVLGKMDAGSRSRHRFPTVLDGRKHLRASSWAFEIDLSKLFVSPGSHQPAGKVEKCVVSIHHSLVGDLPGKIFHNATVNEISGNTASAILGGGELQVIMF